jgi:hypothetical protein
MRGGAFIWGGSAPPRFVCPLVHRHVTLAILTHAYLAVLRRTAIGGGGGTTDRALELLPLTVPEIWRLMVPLVGLPPTDTDSAAVKTGSLAPPDTNAQTIIQNT